MKSHCNGSRWKLESGRARRCRRARKKDREAKERGSRKAK